MFRFRLAGIMRLREYKEQMCRDTVGQCITKLREAEEKENEIIAATLLLEKEIKRAQEGIIDLAQLILGHHYLQYLKKQLVLQKEVVILRKKDLEAARARLFEAMKERKILCKLKEKKYLQYQYEQNKLEQTLLDDLAGRRL